MTALLESSAQPLATIVVWPLLHKYGFFLCQAAECAESVAIFISPTDQWLLFSFNLLVLFRTASIQMKVNNAVGLIDERRMVLFAALIARHLT